MEVPLSRADLPSTQSFMWLRSARTILNILSQHVLQTRRKFLKHCRRHRQGTLAYTRVSHLLKYSPRKWAGSLTAVITSNSWPLLSNLTDWIRGLIPGVVPHLFYLQEFEFDARCTLWFENLHQNQICPSETEIALTKQVFCAFIKGNVPEQCPVLPDFTSLLSTPASWLQQWWRASGKS